jgi:DNA-directed RNA polymerase I, II, and III subunit RPABC2
LVVKHPAKKPATQKKTASKAKKVEEPKEIEDTKKSTRPEDEVVTYREVEYELREIAPQDSKILIGLPWLTRFERARITGARALQLSLGAPPLVKPEGISGSINIAMSEIEHKALPISIRRVLPNGLYQDIPIEWMKH